MRFDKMNGERPKILFAAGGTGGHIFPALAVERALKSLMPEAETKFICGSRPVEVNLYQREGETPFILDVQPLRRGLLAKLKGAAKLALGFAAALKFLRSWKPHRIMGQGGYVTAPVLLAARILKIPYDLQEQNTVPGRANLWFASGAERVYCSFREAIQRFAIRNGKPHCYYSGMPLRKDAVLKDILTPENARRKLNLEPDLPTLLVIGGSQGAKRLYELLAEAMLLLDESPGTQPFFQCLWSAGENNIEWLEDTFKKQNLKHIKVRLEPFIKNMGVAYVAATLAVSRSGAGSVAELLANKVPAILIPLPHSAGDHQKLNAQEACIAGAAICLEENTQTPQSLAEAIFSLLCANEKRAAMSLAAARFPHQDAAQNIAEELKKKLKIIVAN